MSYFRYIDNGEGPTKLFIGGVHGDEGKDVLPLIKLLSNDDFSSGQIYIYNFDKTISITLTRLHMFPQFIGNFMSLSKEREYWIWLIIISLIFIQNFTPTILSILID